jgi:hypothetical protein
MELRKLDSHSDDYTGVLTMADTEWILIKDAAVIADMHVESIRRLCRSGDIQCRQLIRGVSPWEVDKGSLIAYLDSDKNVGGRPRKTE